MHPVTEEKIVDWVRRREEVYEGPFLSNYPDILFELQEGWGAGMTSGRFAVREKFLAFARPGEPYRRRCGFSPEPKSLSGDRGKKWILWMSLPPCWTRWASKCPEGWDGESLVPGRRNAGVMKAGEYPDKN